MSTHTATVETLTAEVRVLMVGNRQVTLSVIKQLDDITPSRAVEIEFQPFGRVRSGRKFTFDAPNDWTRTIHVGPYAEWVGVDPTDGSLVLCTWKRREDAFDLWAIPTIEVVTEWLDLPLIVLAGLR